MPPRMFFYDLFKYNAAMQSFSRLEPIDYLLIGHLTRDLTSKGEQLGGTVAYAARMAYALKMRVGIVTSWGNEFPLEPYLGSIPVVKAATDNSTTFVNIESKGNRVQILKNIATRLDMNLIPESWKNANIVHLGPVAQEVEPSIVRNFPSANLYITPQGWLRDWDQTGKVSWTEWPEAAFVLSRAEAAVISLEDINKDEQRIEEMATASRILVVTEGENGGRVYWNGDVRHFRAPQVTLVNSVGAGDIFAAAFFIQYHRTRDPWEAARFAAQLASLSISRIGMDSIPTPDEINFSTPEVF